MMDVSIVVPVFNSQEYIPQLYRELKEVLYILGKSYELILVDDGSKDETFMRLEILHQKDKRVKVIKLRNNSGQHTALFIGISYSKGDTVIIIDADLQYSPKDIPKFLEKIDEGYDLVSGQRVIRKDPFFSRILPSMLINSTISYLTGCKIKDYCSPFKAFRRNVIERIKEDGTIERFINKISSYNYAEIKINRYSLKVGKSKYTLFKLIKVAFQILTPIIFYKLGIEHQKTIAPHIIIDEILD